MRIVMHALGFAAAATLITPAPAFSQTAATRHHPRAVWLADASFLHIGSGATLGRFSKTPGGDFNSIRSMEEGWSGGDGAGPVGGSPNGG